MTISASLGPFKLELTQQLARHGISDEAARQVAESFVGQVCGRVELLFAVAAAVKQERSPT